MTDSGYVIVTGANRGIGRGIVSGLARQGYSIIMACRDIEGARKTAMEISGSTNNQNIEVERLDLASFKSIRAFAKRILQRGIVIDALINNAGVLLDKPEETEDCYDKTIQTNYLGPALLSFLLLPIVRKNTGKILFTSSLVYKYGTISNRLFMHGYKRYNKFAAYADSKLASLVFAAKFADMAKPNGIAVASIDPGIVNTNIITMNNKVIDSLSNRLFRPLIKTEAEGAEGFIAVVSNQGDRLASYYVGKSTRVISDKYLNHQQKEYLWETTRRAVGFGESEMSGLG